MARQFKSGLDYFPLDTKMDDEIELVESEHGVVGFGVLIKLYQKIYANSYWINWDRKAKIMFSNRINVDINKIDVIINSCIEWEIFDKKMHKKHGILTSCGIQKRYFEIVKRRQRVDIVEEFLLIAYSGYLDENKVIVIINPVDAGINSIDDNSSTQSKVKETKTNKIKETIYTPAFEKWWITYPKRNGRRAGKHQAFINFKKIDKKEWKMLKVATDNYSVECEGLPKDAERFLKKDLWRDYIEKADNEGLNSKQKSDGKDKAQKEWEETQKLINGN